MKLSLHRTAYCIAVAALAVSSVSFAIPRDDCVPRNICGGECNGSPADGDGCWKDGDTYLMRRTGDPGGGKGSPGERRESARRSALGSAKLAFLECIDAVRGDLMRKGLPGMASHVTLSDDNYPARAFRSLLSKAAVLEEHCDESDRCTLLVQIHEKGLRIRVTEYLDRYCAE